MLNATVVKRVNISPGLMILGVKPDEGVRQFQPGQYVALGLLGSAPRPSDFPIEESPPRPDKIIKRSYSVASAPHEIDALEFYIAVLPSGDLTSRLALIKPGDRMFAAPKIVGTFITGEVPIENNLILVATGTGLAPYVSMVRSPDIWTPNRKITLVHGIRFESDIGYHDELLRLAETNPNFTFHTVTSRPQGGYQGLKGHVQMFFDNGSINLDPLRDHVFLCGNPAMIDDMTKLLEARDYQVHSRRTPGNLHVEKYW